MNIITKKVTELGRHHRRAHAITGFYGMNVPYPGFGHTGRASSTSVAIIVLAGLILYLVFKRNDWL